MDNSHAASDLGYHSTYSNLTHDIGNLGGTEQRVVVTWMTKFHSNAVNPSISAIAFVQAHAPFSHLRSLHLSKVFQAHI
jgi:hypothetical protein